MQRTRLRSLSTPGDRGCCSLPPPSIPMIQVPIFSCSAESSFVQYRNEGSPLFPEISPWSISAGWLTYRTSVWDGSERVLVPHASFTASDLYFDYTNTHACPHCHSQLFLLSTVPSPKTTYRSNSHGQSQASFTANAEIRLRSRIKGSVPRYFHVLIEYHLTDQRREGL